VSFPTFASEKILTRFLQRAASAWLDIFGTLVAPWRATAGWPLVFIGVQN
jgi:hypothetical protein